MLRAHEFSKMLSLVLLQRLSLDLLHMLLMGPRPLLAVGAILHFTKELIH